MKPTSMSVIRLSGIFLTSFAVHFCSHPAESNGADAQIPLVASPPVQVNVDRPWHKQLTADGIFPVQLSAISADYASSKPAEPLAVMLVRGEVIANTAKSGPGGVAQISGVREGSQDLIAVSPEGMYSFGYFIVAGRSPTVTSAPLVVEAAMVPATEGEIVAQILGKGPTPASGIASQVIPPEELIDMAMMDIPSFVMTANGVVTGRCVSLERDVALSAPGVRIHFIRQGRIVAEAVTDERGAYEVSPGKLTPGFVSVVAIGSAGYALFAAEVFGTPLSTQDRTLPDGTEQVAVAAVSSTSVIALAKSGSLNFFKTAAQPQIPGFGSPAPLAAAPPGGFGGGAGGGLGGGGAGGGGGLGGALLGAAAGAAAGFALADDDDPVVSPAGP